jgi:hypothetical protein
MAVAVICRLLDLHRPRNRNDYIYNARTLKGSNHDAHVHQVPYTGT